MDRFFYKIHNVLRHRKLLSALLLVGIFSILGYTASRIQFEEDITKLIPISKENRDLEKVLKSVHFTDKVIVNIRKDDQTDFKKLQAYASQFIDSLNHKAEVYVKNIRGKVDEDNLMRTVNFVYDHLPLFLEEEDYVAISQRIEEDSIAARMQSNYKNLIAPSGIVTKDILIKDPLGFSFLALQKLRRLGLSDDFKIKDGFLTSKDENHILLFITPAFGSSETAENAKFADILYALQDDMNAAFPEIYSESYGAALIAVANANQVRQDIQLTISITFTLLVLMLILFYKKIYTPVILFVSPLFGALLAVAVLAILREEISAISLGIGSVLMGVTLDYSIHILTHLRNQEDLKGLFQDVTKPILMSSLTTAMAFLCLLFLDAQALQDLGLFAAVSVLGAAFFALIFIPLFYKPSESVGQSTTVLEKVAAFRFHRHPIVLGIIVLGLLVSLFTYSEVNFDKDLIKLNFESERTKEAMKNLDKVTDLSSKSVYVASYGKSLESTLQRNDSIALKLEALKAQGFINDFNSISVLVHSQRDQKRKIAQWKTFWSDSIKNHVQRQMIENGNALGFKPQTFDRFFQSLEASYETLMPEDYQKIPAILLEDFITSAAEITTITTPVKLEKGDVPKLKAAFKDFPETLVIDRQEMNERFLGALKDDFYKLILFCLCIVILILILFFRSLTLTFVTILPVFFTWFLTLGLMGLLGISFNVFNIIVTTVIFGLGIDYSIFMTQGLLKELRTGQVVMTTYKTAIILSVLTTILGIGVLVFAKHPALFSISVVSVIGMSSAMLNAFTIQPLLFRVFIGSQKRPPTSVRKVIHSFLSFSYFGLGGILISLYSVTLMPLLPIKKEKKQRSLHRFMYAFLKSVLYTNPFVKKKIDNPQEEDFSKPAVIIANHTSFLDVLALSLVHNKLCFFVNDWVYHSPVFGKIVQAAGFFPVSEGIENSYELLKEKIDLGYSIVIFPEGSRTKTNKIRRFHKGAFFLAEKFHLDVVPILIHGNYEVNPKGSFIIDDGRITVRVLPRIKIADLITYPNKAKEVRAYFRKEYRKLRFEIEIPGYFDAFILREYRFKNRLWYKHVQQELKKYRLFHSVLTKEISSTARILHLSMGLGTFDFLLMLYGPERQVVTKIDDPEVLSMLQHASLSSRLENLHFVSALSELDAYAKEVLILDGFSLSAFELELVKKGHFQYLFILQPIEGFAEEEILTLGYKRIPEITGMRVYKSSSTIPNPNGI